MSVTLSKEQYANLMTNITDDNRLYIQGGKFNWRRLIIWIIVLLLLNAILWYYSYYIKP